MTVHYSGRCLFFVQLAALIVAAPSKLADSKFAADTSAPTAATLNRALALANCGPKGCGAT